MGIGTSIVLIAVGAILRFAIHAGIHNVDTNAIGVILMIVGAVGLVVSLAFFGPWSNRSRSHRSVVESGPGGATTRHEEVVVDEAPRY